MKAERANTFLIPLQPISFLTPNIKSLFPSPLIKIEMLKLFTPVLQSLQQNPQNPQNLNLFCSYWRSRGWHLLYGGKWELSPAPGIDEEMMGAAVLGEDLSSALGWFSQRGLRQGCSQEEFKGKWSSLIILSNAKFALFVIQQNMNT